MNRRGMQRGMKYKYQSYQPDHNLELTKAVYQV